MPLLPPASGSVAGEALFTALRLAVGLDPDLLEVVALSLRVSLAALALATMAGLPLGAGLALLRFPGRGVLTALVHALMGLPPVVVGLTVYLGANDHDSGSRPARASWSPRHQRPYDHRLRELIRTTGDTSIATDLGAPRSTATGWLHAEPREVVTMAVLDAETVDPQAQVLELRRRVRILVAVVGLLLALVRVSGVRLDSRLLSLTARKAVLRAIRRGRRVLPLRAVLRVLRISPSSFHGWKTDGSRCRPGDSATCPRRSPNQLTPDEISAVRDMVTSPSYRHVPTSRLAVLAQRLGMVFASPSTWTRLVRQRGWRRPRQRVHPGWPKVGLRASRPDEAWHVDTTVIRLLDGTKAHVHAVIDNFSRRILAFRVAERFDIANALSILVDAARKAVRGDGEASVPMLVVDGGVENYNGGVDGLLEQGIQRRVLAPTELRFSNSLIEAFWRQMKHQWLFLDTLDSVASVRRHVAFYVAAHNGEIPHSTFSGETPDEVYFGTGDHVPGELDEARRKARESRLASNRAASCSVCAGSPRAPSEVEAVAA